MLSNIQHLYVNIFILHNVSRYTILYELYDIHTSVTWKNSFYSPKAMITDFKLCIQPNRLTITA